MYNVYFCLTVHNLNIHLLKAVLFFLFVSDNEFNTHEAVQGMKEVNVCVFLTVIVVKCMHFI